MRPTLMFPLMAAGLLAIGTATMTPASPALRSGPAPAFQRVSLETDLAAAPGCADIAPLFRSYMPSRVAWRPAAAPQAGEDAAPDGLAPAMHQAMHLCAVERFDPRRPFSGARSAVYHL